MTAAGAGGGGGTATAVRDGSWVLDGILGAVAPDGRVLSGPSQCIVRNGVITQLEAIEAGKAHQSNGRVLLPTFVNAHDHGRGRGNVASGIADGPLEEWIISLRGRAAFSQHELVGNGLTMMLDSGVGSSVICVNPQGVDTYGEVKAAGDAAIGVGARAAIVYPFADTMDALYGRSRDASGFAAEELARRLEDVERLAESLRSPYIDVQLGPVGPQWVSENTLMAVADHAHRHERRVHMHLLESRAQRDWADETYPEGIVKYLDSIGLVGPEVCFAHGTHLRADELAYLSGRGCVLSFNASSNLRLCSGIPPLSLARSSDVLAGAGLDGLALGDDGDYWNELRLLRGLEQAQTGMVIDAGALFDRILEAGRQALGGARPAVPSEGAVADFQLVDISGYEHLLEEGWSAADVVLAVATPRRVVEVWVAGVRVVGRPDAGTTWHVAGRSEVDNGC